MDRHTYEMAKHVGLVFQNPENQLFALSIEKDVAFGLENNGVNRTEMRKKVDWALNQTGIYDIRVTGADGSLRRKPTGRRRASVLPPLDLRAWPLSPDGASWRRRE